MKFLTPGRILGLLALLAFALPTMAQSPLGVWRTIDDTDGEPKSHIEVYEQGGKLFGRVLRLLPEGRTCDDCAAQFQGSDMRGVVVLRDMEPNGNEWSGGNIIDPANGRTYRCKMELDGPNRLRVRGFLGISLLGRTQVWERVR